jgi:hypothetical protein
VSQFAATSTTPNHTVHKATAWLYCARHVEQGVIGFDSLTQSLRRKPQFSRRASAAVSTNRNLRRSSVTKSARVLKHAPKTDTASTPKSAHPHSDAESVALQAGDDIESIRQVHSAYVCLEKLVVPMQVDEREEIYPTRSELGALFRVVNEEMQRRIEAADSTIGSLRDALSKQVREAH